MISKTEQIRTLNDLMGDPAATECGLFVGFNSMTKPSLGQSVALL
jgi:hypothetical protein